MGRKVRFIGIFISFEARRLKDYIQDLFDIPVDYFHVEFPLTESLQDSF